LDSAELISEYADEAPILKISSMYFMKPTSHIFARMSLAVTPSIRMPALKRIQSCLSERVLAIWSTSRLEHISAKRLPEVMADWLAHRRILACEDSLGMIFE
jgi:hypothetical protein